MRALTSAVQACCLAFALAACSAAEDPQPESDIATRLAEVENPALRLHGFRESFEIAPVLLAADRHFPPGISVKRGGIPNLVGADRLPNYGDPGTADIATHAETQLLRYSLENPDLRVIMTVTEGLYRIVARRSAGIETLADLKGKRVATLVNTSAGFFLQRMLEREGLSIDDVEVVEADLPELDDALIDGRADALAIWEPESEQGALGLAGDLVEFSGEGVYREIFNLNSTAGNLADPEKRALIKQFLRAVVEAWMEIERDPAVAQQLVHEMSGHPLDIVRSSWKHHNYVAGEVPDLLDVLVDEEQWLAARDGREARSREQLASLIDLSLLHEVVAEMEAQ